MSENADTFNATDKQGREASEALYDDFAADLAGALERIGQSARERLSSLTASASWHKPDIDELIPRGEVEDRLREQLDPWRVRLIEATMRDSLAAFGLGFDVKNPLVQGVLAQMGTKITSISDSVRREIMDVIDEGWNAGLSIRDVAKNLDEQIGAISRTRGAVIARTELSGAQNGGSLAAVKLTKAATYKTWLATADNRTRPTHRTADGQVAKLDESFNVGGHRMHYPGDPSGPSEEVVQCRCTMLYGDSSTGEATLLAAGGPKMKRIHPALSHLLPTGSLSSIRMEIRAAADGSTDSRARWTGEGVMFVETPTGDGRSFSKPPSDAGWPAENGFPAIPWHGELPLPLMAMFQDEHGGWGSSALSTLAGQIDVLKINGNNVYAEGTFNDDPEGGVKLRKAVESGDMTTVSADPYPYAWQYIFPPVPELEEGTMDDLFDAFWGMNTEEVILDESILEQVQVKFTKWSMMGLTAVPFPGFHGFETGEKAQIRVVEGTDNSDALKAATLTAAAAPVAAPAAWFEVPEQDTGAAGLKWLDNGQVYGHIARWDGCHTGFGVSLQKGSECVTTPRSRTDYAYFHLGEYHTAEGNELFVGTITMDTGHAPAGIGRGQVMSHYDDTGTQAAYGVIHDGKYGPWFSGVRAPDLDDVHLVKARAAKPSGDWRNVNGHLELMGVLSVNIPGFPVPQALVAAAPDGSEEVIALFAAGVAPPRSRRKALAARIRYGDRAGLVAAVRGE